MELPYKIFLIFMVLLPPITSQETGAMNQQCSKNFTSDTNNQQLLQANINNLLLSLVGITPLQGFAISSFGLNDETIYGLTWCEWGIYPEVCSDCIIYAAKQIRTICPYSAQSYIRYDWCMLRYDTSNFSGQPDMGNFQPWHSQDVANDPTEFQKGMRKMTGEVIVKAAARDEKFGAGRCFFPKSNVTIYETAQCTRDLQETACKQCLEKLFEYMLIHLDSLAGYITTTSCKLNYNIQST